MYLKPLSDDIEEFIKALLGEDQDQVDVQRNELAGYFRCAPSQITYVLTTRFTPDRGYVIESRRGGGGFVRILRLNKSKADHLLNLINHRIGSSVSVADAVAMILQLMEQGIISDKEAALMRAAVSPRAISLPITLKDTLRASVLREMLLQIALHQKEA